MIHEYFDVDLEPVWEIAKLELPAVKGQLQRLEGDLSTESDSVS